MNSMHAATLVNWLGFLVGVALFSLLGAMVVRHKGGPGTSGSRLLLLTTAILGLVWNISELVVFVIRDFGVEADVSMLTAASYAALGFLPSVVVHSAQNEEGGGKRIVTFAAYALSSAAAVLHFRAALTGTSVPSETAMLMLTVGAPMFALALVVLYFREKTGKKAIWASGLLIFALASLHFVAKREQASWIVELVAHQSSLPLVLVILYQNYRFAFADLFLKRAVSIILLSVAAFVLYSWVAAPLLRYHETHDRDDVQAISLILTLWIATALAYPMLHRVAVWVVDKVILHRADYVELQTGLNAEIEGLESADAILDAVCSRLSAALTANVARWEAGTSNDKKGLEATVDFTPDTARVAIPTTEEPHFVIELGEFQGGRRLLSDETAMLAAVSLATARRIDALRVDHQRCEQEFREQEFSKLAAEAQLTALRAQVNPHFLFNALTTIGYLINTSPEKAFQTLLQLTKLLRGVLSKSAEFWTLQDEIDLIKSYLEIEKARFEERLTVVIDVPAELQRIQVPTLILQPLVENAIKHGVSENRNGGEVRISAGKRLDFSGDNLVLTVIDTGNGRKLNVGPGDPGVGIANITDRLHSHYGLAASFELSKRDDGRTEAKIELPIEDSVGASARGTEVAHR